MNESKISVRYAKSLFELANQKGILETIKADVQLISEVLVQVPEFEVALKSPLLKDSQIRGLFKNTFQGRINPLTYSFLELIVKNNRESFIPMILRNFLEMYDKTMGIFKVTITSCVKVEASKELEIRKLLAAKLNGTIEFTNVIDSSIIGGFVLKYDDKMLDASVAHQLSKLRQGLLFSAK